MMRYVLIALAVIGSCGSVEARGRRVRQTCQPCQTVQPQFVQSACSSGSCPVNVKAECSECELIGLFNAERARLNLPPLEYDADLSSGSQSHSAFMASSGRMTHAANIASSAEIIASGQTSASEVTASWMNSSGHRAAILGNFSRVGYGRVGTMWTARFR